jgi:ATP-binding cassette subfamily F protein 1
MYFGEASMGVGHAVEAIDSRYTGYDAGGLPVGLDGESVDDDVAKALLKRSLGAAALSNKERRRVTAYDEDRAARGGGGALRAGGALTAEGDPLGLANFSVSAAGKAQGGGAGGDGARPSDGDAFENSKDVVIESFSINAHKKELFTNATLRVMHGRRYGLVGPNGQGKSTLLKHMAARAGLSIPSRIDMLYVEQEVVADDTPAVAAVLRADKKRAALTDEEARILAALDAADAAEAAPAGSAAARARLADAARGALEDRLNALYDELAAMKAESSESQARAILAGLGFTADMQERPTKHFSGGWRMRISLARALFMQPDLLLLDEPTNHLDLNAVIWLEDYLSRWRSTLLVVSHDQDFLSAVVTDIVHLEDRKLYYYKGNYDDFKEMHAQKLAKQQKDWEAQQKLLKAMKASGKTSKQAEDLAKSRAKREAAAGSSRKDVKRKGGMDDGGEDLAAAGMELIARPREYVVSFEFTDPPPLAPPILGVSGVNFRYGEKYPWLFRDLNFGIDQASRVAIVGPNGVGKSTLLNLLIGELGATEGEVTRNRFLRVGKYSQHFVDVLPMDRSPVDTVLASHADVGYQGARALLGRFGLEGHAHTIPARDLSGGQKARVVFALLALMAPHMMVLDEPTNNLDIESIDALSEAISVYQGGIVLVSHDARLIRAAECRLWVCDKQTVTHFDGDIDDYRTSLISQIHSEEEKQAAIWAKAAAEQEAARMAAMRERARKLRELRESHAAAAAGNA